MHIDGVPGTLPENTVTLHLPHRDKFLPALYKLPTHPKLQDQEGYPDDINIFLFVGRTGAHVEPVGPGVQAQDGRPCPVEIQMDVEGAGECLLFCRVVW